MSEPESQPQESQSRHPPPRAHQSMIIRVFRTLKRRYHARKSHYDKEHTDERMAKWTRNVGWFTFALVVVGVFTAGILWKSDDTARLRDRAFVYFGDPGITPYPPTKIDRWGVSISLANAGNMPAKRVIVEYDCPAAKSADHITDPFPLAKWNRADIGSVIGPKQGSVIQACNIPIDTITDANSHIQDVFYVLRVTYLDGFSSDTRITEVSRIFRFDNWAEALWFIGPHNCSDEDCPSEVGKGNKSNPTDMHRITKRRGKRVAPEGEKNP